MTDKFLHSTVHSSEFTSCRFGWLAIILLLYFGLRLLFFARAISGEIPPDETTHVELIRIFAETLLFPENSPQTWTHGLVTNIPWLYYWLLGKLLPFNVFGLPDLLYLRLLNIPLAFGTIWYSWRTLRLLTANRLAELLLLVAMTNTLMFTLLSASVSYDNLANLLAAMALYYLCAFFKSRHAGHLGLSWLCQLVGCLVKSSILPLLLILNLVLMTHEFKGLRKRLSTSIVQCREAGWRAGLLLAGLLVALVMNVHLYGGNLLHFGKLLPEMRNVLPLEAVMQNRLAARDEIFIRFVEGQLSYEQAMETTRLIAHSGDREATVYLVNNYLQRRYSGAALMGPGEYLPPWGKAVLASVYGIHGHKTMLSDGMLRVLIAAVFLLAVGAAVLRRNPSESTGVLLSIASVTLVYLLFVLYYVHYGAYLYYEAFVIGLQGRYLFPVLGSFYVLLAWSLADSGEGNWWRWGVVGVAAAIFLVADLPFFLYHVTPDWYAAW